MSGFVFNPAPEPAPVAPEPVITNDGWFPVIDPAAIRAAIRVRDGVLPARLAAAIVAAIIAAANDLDGWRTAREAEGHATLAAIPARTIAGTSRLVLLYHRAIGALVKAELTEAYRDMDVTGTGARDLAELSPSIDELRRDARHAIRDILARTRTCIELI